MVYFIFSPDDPKSLVKIGYTKSLESRLYALQIGCPFRLRLIMAIEGGKDVERKLHARFDRYRSHGEWFMPSEELRCFIRAALEPRFSEQIKQALCSESLQREYAENLGWNPNEVKMGLQRLVL